MKNRIQEFTEDAGESSPVVKAEEAAAAIEEMAGEASRTIRRWAMDHPVSCLAAAFVAGAALAWLIKRR